MNKLASLLCSLVLASLAAPSPVLAAIADHQQCFKIKDSTAAATYSADLVPSDFAFPVASGCVVKVPAKLLCIDVEKTNVVPAPPGAAAGQPAQKSLCYKVKCPSLPAPLSVTETDQFATHSLAVKKAFLLCAPIPVPASTTTTTLPSGCATAGDCPLLPNATVACSAGNCVIGSCDPGYADCNNLTADGCEIDTTSSTAHCGSCNSACAFANASASCTNSACGMGACDPGYADCNNTSADGCEVDTTNTVAHCGSCNSVCVFPNANASCTNSTCAIGSCAPDYGDCNNSVVDGCETYLGANPSNCGGCGNVCQNPNPNCVASTCVP